MRGRAGENRRAATRSAAAVVVVAVDGDHDANDDVVADDDDLSQLLVPVSVRASSLVAITAGHVVPLASIERRCGHSLHSSVLIVLRMIDATRAQQRDQKQEWTGQGECMRDLPHLQGRE